MTSPVRDGFVPLSEAAGLTAVAPNSSSASDSFSRAGSGSSSGSSGWPPVPCSDSESVPCLSFMPNASTTPLLGGGVDSGRDHMGDKQHLAHCEVRILPGPGINDRDSYLATKEQKPLAGKARFKAAVLLVVAHLRASHALSKAKPHVYVDVYDNLAAAAGAGAPEPPARRQAPVAARPPVRLSWIKKLQRQICNEFMIGGEMVCKWITPGATGHHWTIFTPVLLTCMLIVFFFMAAQLPYYLAWAHMQRCGRTPTADCIMDGFPTSTQGPAFLLEWLRNTGTEATTFTFEFMGVWGARYAPAIADGQWQRWFTSQFVHASLVHLVGNMVVFVALGIPLERRFGWARVALVWTLAVVGGQFLSTAMEDPCTQVIGASGGVFGLVGLFAADLVLNRQYLVLPIYRAVTTVMFLAIFLGTVFTQPQVSHFSHLGGLVCGLLPTFLVLPNKRIDTLQRVLPALGLVSLVVWFTVLPIWVYRQVFPNMHCGA